MKPSWKIVWVLTSYVSDGSYGQRENKGAAETCESALTNLYARVGRQLEPARKHFFLPVVQVLEEAAAKICDRNFPDIFPIQGYPVEFF